jgi:aminoglycoside phosphotransferase (APT) family kinase protein
MEPADASLSMDALEADTRRLSMYIAASGSFVGYAGPLGLRRFGFGQSNPTFLAVSPTHSFVLRKKPAGTVIASAHAVEREYRVIKALWEQGKVPVPEPLHLCTDPTIIGCPFYVMRPVTGRIFTDPAMATLDPSERALCYADALRVLGAIHSTDIDVAGLVTFGKDQGRSYYARQLKRLVSISKQQCSAYDGDRAGEAVPLASQTRSNAAQAHASDSQQPRNTEQSHGKAPPLPGIGAITAWLQERLPSGSGCLVHGDFKIDNLVFHPTEPRVIAVLDWELSTLGSPLADLANFVGMFAYPRSPEAPTDLKRADPDGGGVMAAGVPLPPRVEERLFRGVEFRTPHTSGHATPRASPSATATGAASSDAAAASDGTNGAAVTRGKRRPGNKVEGLAGVDLEGSGIPVEHGILTMYCRGRGAPVPLGAWAFAKAFLYFKYAVIAQGVADRAARGVASSSQAKKLGALAPLCAELAMAEMGIDESYTGTRPHKL